MLKEKTDIFLVRTYPEGTYLEEYDDKLVSDSMEEVLD